MYLHADNTWAPLPLTLLRREPRQEAAGRGGARKRFLTRYEEPLPESALASLDTSVAAFLLRGDR